MQRLLRKDVNPPDGHRFTHSETGHTSRGPDYWTWLEAIRAHRRGNNLDLPENMAAIAEDQLCKQLPPSWCERSEKDDAEWVDTRLSFGGVKDWLVAHVKLAFSEFVPQVEAERRAYICAGCFLNVDTGGCGTNCKKLGHFITGSVAQRKTEHDADLKACAVCSCLNSVQVHFPMSILDGNDTPEKQAKYPDFCWKQKASVNYEPNDLTQGSQVERRDVHTVAIAGSIPAPATI